MKVEPGAEPAAVQVSNPTPRGSTEKLDGGNSNVSFADQGGRRQDDGLKRKERPE